MDRRLIDYLPPVLRDVLEFRAITGAQQPLIEDAWNALRRVMDDQFLATASEEAVETWEWELNLTPAASDTLEERKARIQAAWIYEAVYTYRWLLKWITDACGEEWPSPTVDKYTLNVTLPISRDYQQMISTLRKYVPANILIKPLISCTPKRTDLYIGTAVHLGIQQTIQTEEVSE